MGLCCHANKLKLWWMQIKPPPHFLSLQKYNKILCGGGKDTQRKKNSWITPFPSWGQDFTFHLLNTVCHFISLNHKHFYLPSSNNPWLPQKFIGGGKVKHFNLGNNIINMRYFNLRLFVSTHLACVVSATVLFSYKWKNCNS